MKLPPARTACLPNVVVNVSASSYWRLVRRAARDSPSVDTPGRTNCVDGLAGVNSVIGDAFIQIARASLNIVELIVVESESCSDDVARRNVRAALGRLRPPTASAGFVSVKRSMLPRSNK